MKVNKQKRRVEAMRNMYQLALDSQTACEREAARAEREADKGKPILYGSS
jgi:hypothetical protein